MSTNVDITFIIAISDRNSPPAVLLREGYRNACAAKVTTSSGVANNWPAECRKKLKIGEACSVW